MGDVPSETSADDAMPRGKVHGIEFSFDDFCDVVQNTSLLERERHTVDGVLLHLGAHIGVLNHCILCFLLVDVPVGLARLSVGIGHPCLCGFNSRVRLGRCHFFFNY